MFNGYTQFYLPPSRLSTCGMNHPALLPSRRALCLVGLLISRPAEGRRLSWSVLLKASKNGRSWACPFGKTATLKGRSCKMFVHIFSLQIYPYLWSHGIKCQKNHGYVHVTRSLFWPSKNSTKIGWCLAPDPTGGSSRRPSPHLLNQ